MVLQNHAQSGQHHAAGLSETLTSLPPELITAIFNHLVSDWPPRSFPYSCFRALALSCRGLYPFAIKFLYSTYEQPADYASHSFANEPYRSCRPFLRRILSCPQAAKDVTRIDSLTPDGRGVRETVVPVPNDILEQIQRADLPYKSAWQKHFESRPEDTEVALLIFLARNLRILRVTEAVLLSSELSSSERENRALFVRIVLMPVLDFARNIRNQPQPVHDYSNLKELAIKKEDESFSDMICLLRLPSLITLNLDNSYGKEPEDAEFHQGWMVPPRSSSVECIWLNGFFSTTMQNQLLQACRQLRQFLYYPHHDLKGPQDENLSLFQLHSDTLYNLRLPIPTWSRGMSFGLKRNKSILGLTSLKKLEIDVIRLMGKPEGRYVNTEDAALEEGLHTRNEGTLADLLPSQLQTLYLGMRRSSLTGNVDWNAQLRSLLTTNIRKITIFYDHDVIFAPFPIRVHDMQQQCSSHGVQFQFFHRIEIEPDPPGSGVDFRILEHIIACGRDEAMALIQGVFTLEASFGEYLRNYVRAAFEERRRSG